MAWVVGLIIPILSAHCSVNQRLPSGPAVIPSGLALAVGTANSVMAWVVGLIIPILLRDALGEPEVAVGARRDPAGLGAGGRDVANSVMAWVVGLIIPILLAAYSVNQRLPSGPAVIPSGPELAVGMANSVMAWVVGLIIPILLAAASVNQRLPSGPAVIPSRTGTGGRDGELGDRQQATIFQPFEPRPDLMAFAGVVCRAIQGEEAHGSLLSG